RDLLPLSLEEALLYFRQIVGAVAACQAAGVPHPPISSTHILLVEDGHVELVENWRVPLAEFGLDSACYRAPERTAGGPVTHAASVYSLGLLFLELLSGSRVINGSDPQAVAAAHVNTRIAALSALRPQIATPALERLISEATDRDPLMRPQDAATLAAALDDLRQTMARDTRRLPAPPVRPPSLRQRIDRVTGALAAPKRIARPVTPAATEHPDEIRQRRRSQVPSDRRRALFGLGIMVTLFTTVACAAYLLAGSLAPRLIGIEIPPLPDIDITIPESGIALPDWLTGVAAGPGEVLVVTIGSIEGLNLRDAPGLQTQVIGLLPNGTRVRRIDGPQVVDQVPWLLVRAQLNGRTVEGWVSEHFVRALE
ncbi:MAG TPA: SH3 domain-containing protein, partial [Roseiflexaceae bacterium]|nr:SH3 domain-containing protein [Roseiflexaceae bacterium]